MKDFYKEEVEQHFAPDIAEIIQNTEKTGKPIWNSFTDFTTTATGFPESRLRIYNPFGLLNHFDKGGEFLPYWYETGMPAFFLLKLFEQSAGFRKFDIDRGHESVARAVSSRLFDGNRL